MIERIKGQTRTTELDAVTARIFDAYQSSSLTSDNNLINIFGQLQVLSANLNQAINRIKSESELEEKDELRDDAIRSFYYLILGCTHHPDEGIKTAAVKVMTMLNKYGLQILSESYDTETSLLNSLLTELAKPEMQEAVAMLSGAAECIVTIQNTQKSFETSRLAFEQDKAEEGTYLNATSIKKDILKLINGKLVIYLKAMNIVEEATYGSFSRIIAQIIIDSNEVVKKRSKKTTPEIE